MSLYQEITELQLPLPFQGTFGTPTCETKLGTYVQPKYVETKMSNMFRQCNIIWTISFPNIQKKKSEIFMAGTIFKYIFLLYIISKLPPILSFCNTILKKRKTVLDPMCQFHPWNRNDIGYLHLLIL